MRNMFDEALPPADRAFQESGFCAQDEKPLHHEHACFDHMS